MKAGLLRRFVDWMESGYRVPEDLLLDCLETIRARDGELHAWVAVDPQPALADGPLRGIPFGAKDIFETLGLVTEYGSPLYKGRKGTADALFIRRLRSLGAVLVGKTETSAFAYFDPAPTRNPRNPAHTPGGSSSGSAAVLAAGMVPFTLGTQTLGSVIRPASYCGVVGFKPAHGTLPLDGVMSFAPSLDTVGLFTETADDMRLLWELLGFPKSEARVRRLGAPTVPPVVDGVMRDAFRDSLARLRDQGFETVEVEMPPGFDRLDEAARTVAAYEVARSQRKRWDEHGDKLGTKLAEMIRRGLEMSDQEYHDARGLLADVEYQMRTVFDETPFLVTPAATGAAPLGLDSTGDPVMNSPWTGMGVPAISVPMTIDAGLPLGMQIVTAASNAALLETAAAIETRL